MTEVTFEITQKVAVLRDRGKGWRKEINLVSWNGAAPRVDIREWNLDHTSMKKGLTFSRQEYQVLLEATKSIDINDVAEAYKGRAEDVKLASGQ